MTSLRLLLSTFAIAGLLAAGCGDDEDSGSNGGEQAGGSGDSGGKVVEVGMEGIKYVPMAVTVPVGGTVKWTNSDTPTHTVTKQSGPGAKFDSGTMNPGDNFEQKFTEAGKVNYFCEIHPFQKGTVTVE